MYSLNRILVFVVIGLAVVNATPVPAAAETDAEKRALILVDRQCIPKPQEPSECDLTCLVTSALKRAVGAEVSAPTERRANNDCAPPPDTTAPDPSDCDVTCLVTSALKRALALGE